MSLEKELRKAANTVAEGRTVWEKYGKVILIGVGVGVVVGLVAGLLL